MLQLDIKSARMWNEKTEEFFTVPEQSLRLEHSLVSLRKWESKWHKPFLGRQDTTSEEMLDYIRCMTITPNVDPNVYYALSAEDITKVRDYIANTMTATTFVKREGDGYRNNGEQITAELVYYWMIACQIPFECEKWHLNQLFTLIRLCGEKNKEPKKMKKGDIMRRNAALNAARRARSSSKG